MLQDSRPQRYYAAFRK